jgi:hypothetical protein
MAILPPYRRFQQALISGQHTGGALTDMDGGPTIRLLKPTQRPVRCAPDWQYIQFIELLQPLNGAADNEEFGAKFD